MNSLWRSAAFTIKKVKNPRVVLNSTLLTQFEVKTFLRNGMWHKTQSIVPPEGRLLLLIEFVIFLTGPHF